MEKPSRTKMSKKKNKKAVEEEEEEYHVEKIIDKRFINGIAEYFLKWQGFSELENTWEPEHNLNCTELLAEFNREHSKNREVDKLDSKNNESEKPGSTECKSKEEKLSLTEAENVQKKGTETVTEIEKQKKENKPVKEKGRSPKKEKKEKKKADETNKESKNLKRKATKLETSSRKKKKLPKAPVVTGFDKGYQAQNILGATDTAGGELHFLISWADSNDAELVPARIANVKIPQMVIKFYEDRLIWTNNKSAEAASGSKESQNEQSSSIHVGEMITEGETVSADINGDVQMQEEMQEEMPENLHDTVDKEPGNEEAVAAV